MKKKQKMNRPILRFSPTAWAKLIYFRDYGDTEIGGFGITRSDDLLYIKEFMTVKQIVTGASVSFDDEAVANFFEEQVDLGRQPEQFARIWLHSHPGDSPEPSCVDEETFQRVFGGCDWAVIFVIGIEGKTYSRLRFNTGPGGSVMIPTFVDYEQPFEASDNDAWELEYKSNIHPDAMTKRSLVFEEECFGATEVYSEPEDVVQQLEIMSPVERNEILNEIASRCHLWADESEVFYDE